MSAEFSNSVDLCRTPEKAPSNPRGSIEPRLRTTEPNGVQNLKFQLQRLRRES